MKRYPHLWSYYGLLRYYHDGPKCDVGDGDWVPDRPLGYPSIFNRVKIAWIVFIGRADAFTWPKGQ